MFRKLLEKWFGIEPYHCESCEILREQLNKSEAERKDLLRRLLDKPAEPPPVVVGEEPKPLKPQFTPWRVRQQMLEEEDRKAAQLLKNRAKEVSDLEKELGVVTEKADA